jgi:hypothetical protein
VEKLPQFVASRLSKPQASAEPHPNADLLTAFAEQLLAGAERASVIEHLARCGDCREVIAIALPELEIELASVPTAGSGFNWLRWPVLSWAALAAGIIAVASIGVVQYQARHNEKIVATAQLQEAIAEPTRAQNQHAQDQRAQDQHTQDQPVAAATPKLDSHGTKREPVVPTTESAHPHPRSLSSARKAAVGASGLGGGLIAQEIPAPSADANTAVVASRPAGIGASSQTMEVNSAQAIVNTESPEIAAQNQIAQNQIDLPLNGRSMTNLDVVKAKNPVPARSSAAQSASPMLKSEDVSVRTWPQWSVTVAGVLQRSFDEGKTWEPVNPTAIAIGSAGNNAQVSAAPVPYAQPQSAEQKPAANQPLQKTMTGGNPNLLFHAVASFGPEVWAGGSGGALYHTSDGGNLWTRVTPSAAGAALAGDITGIQFPDLQHGTVATSTAELWSTSDNGASWQKLK